jgi:hypothetical protein
MKAAAIAEAIINTIKGVMNAVGLGPFGIAQAATIAAMGTVQVAKIAAQTLGFEKGGTVPGSGTGDTVPAMLTPKEFVQPKNSVDYYGVNFMEAIRQKLIPKEALNNLGNTIGHPMEAPKIAYETGGLVTAPAGNNGGFGKSVTNVSVINANNNDQLEGLLQTRKGRNTLVNIIGNNKNEFKKALYD